MMHGKVLVTGAAGFIGMHVARALAARGESVLGVDNLNAYYDPALKRARLAQVEAVPGWTFERTELADREAVNRLFEHHEIRRVVHLAAQAGVRYSFEDPHAYVQSNLVAFVNLLEACRHHQVGHLAYASSSSVYGNSTRTPFRAEDPVDEPISLYAATKRADELMALVYSLQFGIPASALRFFTVYGPWGRPDMAPVKFTRALLAGETIDVYGHGEPQRDFTFIDDAVDAVLRVLDAPPKATSGKRGAAPHRIINIGNHRPEPLMRFIEVLAKATGHAPALRMLPMQPGDVMMTCADIEPMQRDFGWEPHTTIDEGLPRTVQWVRDFYGES
jgi:UDP-glucuronate 4-epimerase